MAINPNVLWISLAAIGVLAIGSIVRLARLRGEPQEIVRQRIGSLNSWWAVATVVVAAALGGRIVAAALFAAVSLLAMREFSRLTPDPSVDRRLAWLAYALILTSYLWIAVDWSNVFVVWLPLAMLMVLSARLIAAGQTGGYRHGVSRTGLGLLLTGYCLPYLVLLMNLAPETNPIAGPQGWFLFLILVMESTDIAQALVGRQFGRRKITPHVSPNKTWEGFLAGMVVAVVLSIALAPWLTNFTWIEAAVAGLLVALFGFLGDLNISAIKRDVGVKDSGDLLPGQGGILDRIDSLTFAAPVFYFYVVWIVGENRG